MRKPRLTAKRIHGLLYMAGLVEAGDCADTMGLDSEDLDAEGRYTWKAILSAVEFVNDLHKWHLSKTGEI